ncbi:hypothetical protein FV228_12935 [Methylobacterium sp. WL18]|uniref:hypothetical protein n=1 Tax=Methylobacterium sp. WL18 TaxID=2603897 RepID=UPI0011CCD9C7|nr:hypothetical protein [Methylobacterium sp. WL18]TXN69151.1 hypothetical protein FV228_12935 [Methylobacterium sp. WL18]
MPVNAPSFVDGLVALDASQTRKRLAAALAEARLHAQWTAGPSGDGIAEAIRHVDGVLLEGARWAIKRLDDALLASRSAPARQETLAEAHAAVVAALDRDDDPITPVVPRTPDSSRARSAGAARPRRLAAEGLRRRARRQGRSTCSSIPNMKESARAPERRHQLRRQQSHRAGLEDRRPEPRR